MGDDIVNAVLNTYPYCRFACPIGLGKSTTHQTSQVCDGQSKEAVYVVQLDTGEGAYGRPVVHGA